MNNLHAVPGNASILS